MKIKDELLQVAEKFNLKSRALNVVDEIIDLSIASDLEKGIDFLKGNLKSDLIYEFGAYEFHLDENDYFRIIIKINIYSKKLYGANFDCPVGYYYEHSSFKGEHIDKYLEFDWSIINFDIDYYLEKILNVTPNHFFKRNTPQYEFMSYINHIFVLCKSKQFDIVSIFIKRSLDYIEKQEGAFFKEEYFCICNEFLTNLFYHIQINELVDKEKLKRYRIKERLKKKI